MRPLDIRNSVIPPLHSYVGFPVIESDQEGDIPEDTHAVFTFTTPDTSDFGTPSYTVEQTSTHYIERMTESQRVVMSFTAVAYSTHDAIDAAQKIRDWFTFHGYDDLSSLEVVVITAGGIGNRDSINQDERRYGFDVTLRVPRELVRESTYIETADVNVDWEPN